MAATAEQEMKKSEKRFNTLLKEINKELIQKYGDEEKVQQLEKHVNALQNQNEMSYIELETALRLLIRAFMIVSSLTSKQVEQSITNKNNFLLFNKVNSPEKKQKLIESAEIRKGELLTLIDRLALDNNLKETHDVSENTKPQPLSHATFLQLLSSLLSQLFISLHKRLRPSPESKAGDIVGKDGGGCYTDYSGIVSGREKMRTNTAIRNAENYIEKINSQDRVIKMICMPGTKTKP